MAHPRFLWILRIAVSVMCLIAYTLVIAFWFRSYRCADFVYCDFTGTVAGIESRSGQLTVRVSDGQDISVGQRVDWGIREVTKVWIPVASLFTFDIRSTSHSLSLYLPHWFVALVFAPALIGIGPWVPLSIRFSLRSLLIGTALVAVVLGLVVAIA